jgi:hypothetical protein
VTAKKIIGRKGRPSLGKSGKSPRLSISVSPRQLARWHKSATAAGLSLSEWIRKRLDGLP